MNLTNDQLETIKTNLRKSRVVSQELQEHLESGTLAEETKATLSSLLESYVVDALSELDYESVLKEEHEKRYEDIRRANQRIQELEKQLANTHELTGFKQMFRKVQDIIRKWWKQEGFVHVEDVTLLGNGTIQITFAFALSMRVSMFSKNKEADRKELQEHIQYLRDTGFEFYSNQANPVFTKDLLKTDKNEELLTQLVQSRFPSFELQSVKGADLDGEEIIMSFTGVIKDFDDFETDITDEKGGKDGN